MVSTKDTHRFCLKKAKLGIKNYENNEKEMAVSHNLAGGDIEMRKILIVGILTIALITAIGLVSAGYGPGDGTCDGVGSGFVDENDDGVCDNWVDEDDDGINDNRQMDGAGNQYKYGEGQGLGKRYGSGDGLGHGGNGPHDGTGHGPGNCQD
jgi:hypothetical protein